MGITVTDPRTVESTGAHEYTGPGEDGITTEAALGVAESTGAHEYTGPQYDQPVTHEQSTDRESTGARPNPPAQTTTRVDWLTDSADDAAGGSESDADASNDEPATDDTPQRDDDSSDEQSGRHAKIVKPGDQQTVQTSNPDVSQK